MGQIERGKTKLPAKSIKQIESRRAELLAKYGPVVLNTDNLSHGIGCDLLRLKGILKHGILSAKTAASRGF